MSRPRGPDPSTEEILCQKCGGLAPQQQKGRIYSYLRLCPTCALKLSKWSRSCFVVVGTPPDEEAWRGGHFASPDMRESLKEGCFPDGLLFEQWIEHACVGLSYVQGNYLIPMSLEEYKPRGDGVFLGVPIPEGNRDRSSLRDQRRPETPRVGIGMFSKEWSERQREHAAQYWRERRANEHR